MHKKLMVMTALVVMAAAAGTSFAAPAKKKPAKVAYLTYLYFDYQKVEERGIKDVVKADGGSVKVFNADFNPQKQQQQCTDAVQSKRYNAIVLAPVDSASGIPCVRAAKAAGIPVVQIETPVGKNNNAIKPQVPGVVGSVVTTPPAAATNMAKLVKQACAGIDPCKVIAEQTPGEPFTTGWVAAADKLPNVEIVQRFSTTYDPAKTAQMLPDALQRNKDADVFLSSQDEGALVAINIVKQAGAKVKILGSGGSRRAVKAIKAGTIFGTLGTWPRLTGNIAGRMVVKAVNGERIAKPAVNGVTLKKPEIVTKATVNQFKPEWGAE